MGLPMPSWLRSEGLRNSNYSCGRICDPIRWPERGVYESIGMNSRAAKSSAYAQNLLIGNISK